jgi:hypothetical protein
MEEITGINTQPYPAGEHPVEIMKRQTAPYKTRLGKLLIELCTNDKRTEGVPENKMEDDLGTGIAKNIKEKALIHEIAKEITGTAQCILSQMDTEKIEVDENDMSITNEVTIYFDTLIGNELLKVLPDERLNALIMLNSLKDEICNQLIEIHSLGNRDRYILSIKNAIKYIIDSVMQNGINKSLTLQINV